MAKLTVPIVVDWDSIKDRIKNGDLVEVVRCKNCRHLSADRIAPEWNRICRKYGCGKPDDGYCNESERKETEDV